MINVTLSWWASHFCYLSEPVFSGIWIQQLLCHSTTLMIGTLCPISTLKQQPNNLKQTYFRFSLHCEQWTVEGSDCKSALHFFRRTTNRTDKCRKHLLRMECWVISGSPERWMEFRRLWWSVVVFRCSYFFGCVIFSVCWCNNCFLEKFFIAFLMTSSENRISSITTM